jgi:non-specific protein-tyrosine kinase
VTDAVVLAQRVDGVILIARYGHAVVQDLRAAKDALTAVSARILGSVLTLVPRRSMRRCTGRKRRPLARRAGQASIFEPVGEAVSVAESAHSSSAGRADRPEPDGGH